jgi:hypothetical protein
MGVLTRTIKSKLKMQENFKLRNLESGAYCICTGNYQSGHLNFSAMFKKNILFERKKIKS